MSSLADFLLARIAEDENLAHRCVGTRWHAQGWSELRTIPEDQAGATEPYWHQIAVISYEGGPGSRSSEHDVRPTFRHFARWDPARVLAECDAKRRIVKAWGHVLRAADLDPFTRQVRETAGHVFRCLALPYAEHPDYRQEWKP